MLRLPSHQHRVRQQAAGRKGGCRQVALFLCIRSQDSSGNSSTRGTADGTDEMQTAVNVDDSALEDGASVHPISASTLGHYNSRADSFWEGTRDHDVSQNITALLEVRHVLLK